MNEPRVKRDDDGTLDDFMARDVAMVHFEALDESAWYATIQLANGDVWHLDFGAKSPRAKGYAKAELQGNFPIQHPT